MSAVYAIGVTAGRFARPDGSTEHRLRRGRDLHGLDDFTIGLWSAARGVADTEQPFQDRSTVQEMHAELLSEALRLDVHNDAFLAEAGKAFDRLVADGLLVEISLDHASFDAFTAFARSHTFHAQLVGLGENDSGTELVGTPRSVMGELDSADWTLWRRADEAATVFDALTSSHLAPAEQARRIRTHLPRLHLLGARGLGFFDVLEDTEKPVQYMTTAAIQTI